MTIDQLIDANPDATDAELATLAAQPIPHDIDVNAVRRFAIRTGIIDSLEQAAATSTHARQAVRLLGTPGIDVIRTDEAGYPIALATMLQIQDTLIPQEHRAEFGHFASDPGPGFTAEQFAARRVERAREQAASLLRSQVQAVTDRAYNVIASATSNGQTLPTLDSLLSWRPE